MCGIAAAVGDVWHVADTLCRLNLERGRDGFGITEWYGMQRNVNGHTARMPGLPYPGLRFNDFGRVHSLMLNCRAEPTTELVPEPTDADQQPYVVGDWTVVHNGTIANDKELLKQFDLESPTRIDSWVIAGMLDVFTRQEVDPATAFANVIFRLEGSFAILARGPDGVMRYATNYRPLFRGEIRDNHGEGCGDYMSSVRVHETDVLVTPYTYGTVSPFLSLELRKPARVHDAKTLVVLSGGLDSTVVASKLIHDGHEVEFLHFAYGCRAEGPERTAVEAIARHFNRPLRVIDTDIFRLIGHSRLLDGSRIDNGEAGAEQAIEWVPARNTIMASIAIGIAEANGFDHIALGINLEESGGGYTDNVLDLYEGLNNLMQWIIGVDKRLSFIWPVGSLMKHEIVQLGLSVDAPFHLTWSCYNKGNKHCGECGPCTMRQRAFMRYGKIDPVFASEGV